MPTYRGWTRATPSPAAGSGTSTTSAARGAVSFSARTLLGRPAPRRPREPAALDVVRLPGDERARIRGEQQTAADQLLRVARPAEETALHDPAAPHLVVPERLRQRRQHEPGAQRVDADAVLGPLDRHRLRELAERRLVRAVHGDA